MKLIAALSVCLFVAQVLHGQTAATTPKGTPDKKAGANKGVSIMGTIKTMHNKPIKGVEAFVYQADSTIVASGNTDAEGRYSTNGVPPGTYFVKLIYPTRKVTVVYGITIKTQNLELSLNADAPDADTMYSYDHVKPKPVAKKEEKKQ